MKNTTYTLWMLMIGLCLFSASCTESEEMMAVPPTSDDLSFTYTVDNENPNIINFMGQTSVDAWFVHFNFGDNSGAEGLEARKTYFKAGEYEVRFKIITEGGEASITETIVIEQDFAGPDLIENGGFDTDASWTVLEISPGVEVNIANGEAAWSGGSWGNAAIFQKIEVEADKEYQINMDVRGGGLSDCWFEVFIGTLQPQQGVDYSDGGIQIGMSTWEGCGVDDFMGALTDVACVGNGGAFSWSSPGEAYIVIKSGGANMGDQGVTIDNIAIRSL